MPPNVRLRASRGIRAGFLGALAPRRDELSDRLAPLDLAAAVIEHSVGRERSRVTFGIAVVEREHVSRLQILNQRAVVAIAGVCNACHAREGGGDELFVTLAAHGTVPLVLLEYQNTAIVRFPTPFAYVQSGVPAHAPRGAAVTRPAPAESRFGGKS